MKFLEGFPGRYVVLARRSDRTWYVAGINAEKTPRNVSLDLRELGAQHATLITDGDGANLSFRQQTISPKESKALDITLAPRGGFVLTAH